MKKQFYLLGICFCAVFNLTAQIANSKEYLNTIKEELTKTWPDNKTINIVFHGHSVPSGYFATPIVNTLEAYPHLVLNGLKEIYPYAVVNIITTSIGGENSEQGEVRFSSEVLTMRPDVLLIDYALNDRGIGLERTEQAWCRMIESALEYGCKVILLTPTPDTTENIQNDNALLTQYSDLIRKLAGKYNVGLVDSYQAFKELSLANRDINEYMSQNNHPNGKGHQLVADEIMIYFK